MYTYIHIYIYIYILQRIGGPLGGEAAACSNVSDEDNSN